MTTKRADIGSFPEAVRQMANQQLKAEAMHDIRNLGLATLGVGAGARGLSGLLHLMRGRKPASRLHGPHELSLPIPVAATDKEANFVDLLKGNDASTKAGLPFYGPAMMLTGMTGLGAGWKGMDSVLDARRERQRKHELDAARKSFHDALLAQYGGPVDMAKVGEAESPMVAAGRGLDRLFADIEKAAFDWANAAGTAAGAYGTYAGISGLLAGALMFDKASKRNRRAIVDAALKRRERARFMQQPPEIYATPEPVEHFPAAPEPEKEAAHSPLRDFVARFAR